MNSFSQTVRRSSSIALAVSFLALLVSGGVMMFADGLAPRLRMHPVHEVFGLVMVVAGLAHVAFNARALCGYLRSRWAAFLGAALAALVALLLVAGLHRPLDTEAVHQIEKILAEGHERR